MTMVQLEISRTTVLTRSRPSRCKCSWASTNSCGYWFCIKPKPTNRPPNSQDFGGQEQPHTNLAGIELLLHGGEVMLVVRIVLTMLIVAAVRVNVDSGRTHDLVRHRLGPVIVRLMLEHRLSSKL